MRRVWVGLLVFASLGLAAFAAVEQGEIQDLMIEVRKRDLYEAQLLRDVSLCKAQEICSRCRSEMTRFREAGMDDVCAKYCETYEKSNR